MSARNRRSSSSCPGSRGRRKLRALARGAAPRRSRPGFRAAGSSNRCASAAQRGERADIRITAVPGKDVVVLHIAGGPALVLHPESARDLLLAQAASQASRERRWRQRSRARRSPGSGRACSGRDWNRPRRTRSAATGCAGKRAARRPSRSSPASARTPPRISRRRKSFVASMRKSIRAFPSSRLNPAQAQGHRRRRCRNCLHPTASRCWSCCTARSVDTSGTFGKLWMQHPQHVDRCSITTGSGYIGFEHPTLGDSPIENALALRERVRDRSAPAPCLPIPVAASWPRCSRAFVRTPAWGRTTLRSSKEPYRAQRER